jgi:hypothetical protein
LREQSGPVHVHDLVLLCQILKQIIVSVPNRGGEEQPVDLTVKRLVPTCITMRMVCWVDLNLGPGQIESESPFCDMLPP